MRKQNQAVSNWCQDLRKEVHPDLRSKIQPCDKRRSKCVLPITDIVIYDKLSKIFAMHSRARQVYLFTSIRRDGRTARATTVRHFAHSVVHVPRLYTTYHCHKMVTEWGLKSNTYWEYLCNHTRRDFTLTIRVTKLEDVLLEWLNADVREKVSCLLVCSCLLKWLVWALLVAGVTAIFRVETDRTVRLFPSLMFVTFCAKEQKNWTPIPWTWRTRLLETALCAVASRFPEVKNLSIISNRKDNHRHMLLSKIYLAFLFLSFPFHASEKILFAVRKKQGKWKR